MTLFTKHMQYCPIPIAFIVIFATVASLIAWHEYYPIFIAATAVIMGFTIMYLSITMSQNCERKKTIPLSYLCLGIAYMAYAVAELVWFLLDWQGMATYPSMADHIYTIYFIFSIAHVIITYRYFVKRTRRREAITILAVLGIILAGYGYHIVSQEANLTLAVYGGAFVSLAAILLVITGMVVYKLRDTKLFGAWVLIGIGIAIGAAGDLWYYPLDVMGVYEYGHPVDIVWVASDAIIIFALTIHRKLV